MSSVSSITLVVLDLVGIFVFAISGALVAVRMPTLVLAFAGAGVCLVWRLLALRLHWRAPMPTGPANV